MKIRYFLLLMSLFAVLFTGCEKDSDSYAYGPEFKESHRVWLNFKASSNNSYRYTVITSSWIGLYSETVITVESGRVTGRSFTLRDSRNAPAPTVITEQWTEDRNSLNSHERGAETLTLDQVYEKAKKDWLKIRDNMTNYFEANNAGMISICSYVPNGCQDDCSTGIRISSIERL